MGFTSMRNATNMDHLSSRSRAWFRTSSLLLIALIVPTRVLCAEPAEGGNIDDLLRTLSTAKPSEEKALAAKIAAYEEAAVQPVLDAMAEGRLHQVSAAEVMEKLRDETAKALLIPLISDPDIYKVEWVAGIFAENPTASAAGPLREALNRSSDESCTIALAMALWYCEQDKPAATSAILGKARTMRLTPGHRCSLELLGFLDCHGGKLLMTDEERLDLVLDWKMAAWCGVEALDIVLRVENGRAPSFLNSDDEVFAAQHREMFIEAALSRLRMRACPAAALLLGCMQEPRALPFLRKCLLTEGTYYGWEANYQDPLWHDNYPQTHCYEEAIRYTTGLPLEKAIRPTKGEMRDLLRRCAGEVREYDEDRALYILHRLAPGKAFEEASRRFRKAPHSGQYAMVLAHYFLKPGLGKARLRELLGPPDKRTPCAWWYSCTSANVIRDEPITLVVFFQRGRVKDAGCMEDGHDLKD